jgi:peroxiredoxin
MNYVFLREDLVDLKKEHMMAIAINDFCVDKSWAKRLGSIAMSQPTRLLSDIGRSASETTGEEDCNVLL